MAESIPIVAGSIATLIFVVSYLPMLWKAGRTKELSSYSLGQILLANVGNAVYSVYVFHLPPGPIWGLHAFYLVSSALMLIWYLKFAKRTKPARSGRPGVRHEDLHLRNQVPAPRLLPVTERAGDGRSSPRAPEPVAVHA